VAFAALKSPDAPTGTSSGLKRPPRRSVIFPSLSPARIPEYPPLLPKVTAAGASLSERGHASLTRTGPLVREQRAAKAASSSAGLLYLSGWSQSRFTRTVISGENRSIVPSLSSTSATTHSFEPAAAGGVASLKRPPAM
jgi:hypothetical protein